MEQKRKETVLPHQFISGRDKPNKILIVAAHPDDETLGCGATVARLAADDKVEVHALILGEGITSRDNIRNVAKRRKEINKLVAQARCAHKTIKISHSDFLAFPDNRFDFVPLLDIVKAIEKKKNILRPDIIFTHFGGDLNIDHRITNAAVLTATRPVPSETVKTIYLFEIPSSTEWNFPSRFVPDTFFDVSETINLKIAALKFYESESREYPHPRAPESVETLAKINGIKVGLKYAEAFMTARRIIR